MMQHTGKAMLTDNAGQYNSGLGGLPPQAACERVEKRIPSALNQQDKVITELHNLLGELEGVLQNLSSPSPINDDKKENTPCPSTLFGVLENNNDGINYACERVRKMLSQIEL